MEAVASDEVTVTLPVTALWGTRITLPDGVWEYHHRGWIRIDEESEQ